MTSAWIRAQDRKRSFTATVSTVCLYALAFLGAWVVGLIAPQTIATVPKTVVVDLGAVGEQLGAIPLGLPSAPERPEKAPPGAAPPAAAAPVPVSKESPKASGVAAIPESSSGSKASPSKIPPASAAASAKAAAVQATAAKTAAAEAATAQAAAQKAAAEAAAAQTAAAAQAAAAQTAAAQEAAAVQAVAAKAAAAEAAAKQAAAEKAAAARAAAAQAAAAAAQAAADAAVYEAAAAANAAERSAPTKSKTFGSGSSGSAGTAAGTASTGTGTGPGVPGGTGSVTYRGAEMGNAMETTFGGTSDKVGRNVYVEIYRYMPLPMKIDDKIYQYITAKETFRAYYQQSGSEWRLKSQVPVKQRENIWYMLEQAGYDASTADFKTLRKLSPVVLEFTLSPLTKGKVELLDLRLVSSSGSSEVDEAVIYGFRLSTYKNGTGAAVAGRFVYEF
jgi:TolA protein